MEGIIIKGVGGLYTILDKENNREVKAKARGIFRKKSITPLPGDNVVYSSDGQDSSIEEIKTRKNELIRPSISNVTQAILVFALKSPDINWDLLNIFLVILTKKEIKPIIIFNKIDLASTNDIEKAKSIYEKTPYEFLFISAKNDDIKEKIRPYLKDNLTVLMGPSGAGKSTMLNNILGREKMFTGEISNKIGRGKHTTRHTELIEIADGLLADTPGFSSMELIGIESLELPNLMPEFYDYLGGCKFQNCTHIKEPVCSIKEHVGIEISEERYDFYKRHMEKLKEGEKRKWQ